MNSDDVLVRRIRTGDSAALDELITKYYPRILSYCSWRIMNRNDAEDATQDTFLKLVLYLDSYEQKGKFSSFLYKIATNVCVDYFRRRRIESPNSEAAHESPSIEERIELNDSFAWRLRNLSEEQKNVVILRFAGELKIREIAEIMDIPIRTAQSRLRIALKHLERDYLDEN